jgi:hypothetical protein
MPTTPVRDWVLPRLDALIAEAVQNGMDRQTVVAVITDLVEGPDYNEAVTRPEDEPQPTGVSDPAQEPIPTSALPVSRAEWFPYSPSALPDPEY